MALLGLWHTARKDFSSERSTWRGVYGTRIDVLISCQLQNAQDDRWQEENVSCCRKNYSVTEIQDFEALFCLRAAMAEERFISTCDLSSTSSFSISSPDSTASSTSSGDMMDSGNSSWGFSPPPMPNGNGGPLFPMKSLSDSLPYRKRGLSIFFTGKSQSFTSLGDVKCVEELAKPEKKKLRSSHSRESTRKS